MDIQLHPMDRMQVTLPNYSNVLNFEKNFSSVDVRLLSKPFLLLCHLRPANFWKTSNKPKFEIKGMLVSWNIVIALLLLLVLVEYHRNCTTY
ncbi:hypothetical protein E2986_13622 [Frieseomelitta varia]|uniref:Uncharacterized protein n=1 Tax=Frieseomelitta varia TaxID=561572 RepID=A0A833SCQ7_9HYME|nr:hypothetical protein E2986_13622 [Frieseomelitta varia]